jgi:hypothetical protein
MTLHPLSPKSPASGDDYATLRRGGASASHAQLRLVLSDTEARRMEKIFRARALRGGGDAALPKFARHEAHVARVMTEGGFPTFTERRRGKAGACVRLPLIWPAPESRP